MANCNITSKPDQIQVNLYAFEKVIMCAILVTISLTGTVGNFMTCVIFIKNKALRTRTNYLIVSLAVADVLQSLNMICVIASLLSGGWQFGDTMCQFSGWANVNFALISLVSVALIGINRYFKVVRTTGKRFFTKKFTIIVIACAWIFPSSLSLGPVFGWALFRYQPAKLMCFWRYSDSISFAMVTMNLGILFPFSTICFTTYKIIRHVRKSSSRVANARATMPLQQRHRHENRMSIMLLSVIFCFLIFYAPVTTVNMIQLGYGKRYSLPSRAHTWTVVVALFSHAINPLIYCILNKTFRKGFKGICSKEKQREIQLNREVTVVTQASCSKAKSSKEKQIVNHQLRVHSLTASESCESWTLLKRTELELR